MKTQNTHDPYKVFFESMLEYVFSAVNFTTHDIISLVNEIATNPEGRKAIMNVAEELREEGKEIGRQEERLNIDH